MKVSELEGAELDYWVAKAMGWTEGVEFARITNKLGKDTGCWTPIEAQESDEVKGATLFLSHGWSAPYRPSTDWNIGGPIIERERIWLCQFEGELLAPYPCEDRHPTLWHAFIGYELSHYFDVGRHDSHGSGPFPLIAAMRAFVASKFGEEVE